jgi:hypothetical protein
MLFSKVILGFGSGKVVGRAGRWKEGEEVRVEVEDEKEEKKSDFFSFFHDERSPSRSSFSLSFLSLPLHFPIRDAPPLPREGRRARRSSNSTNSGRRARRRRGQAGEAAEDRRRR